MGNFTLNLTKNAVKKGFISQLSGKRVLNELHLMFSEPNPIAIVERMHALGVLRAINPHFTSIQEIRRLFRSIRAVIAWYELLYREEAIDNWILYFLGFVDKLSDHEVYEFCIYLKITKKVMQKIRTARNGYNLIERPLYDNLDTLQNSDIYAVFKDIPLEAILFWMAKTKQEFVKKAGSTYLSKLRDIKTLISGKDLIQLGLKPSPLFQEILTEVLNARLNGNITSKEQELELAKERVAKLHASQR
jgi:tRNA nucleotidyltransferase (CCA-adding enzyme)